MNACLLLVHPRKTGPDITEKTVDWDVMKQSILTKSKEATDGAHGIAVQNVTSNCNVATLNSFFFSLYNALLLERLSFAGKMYENRFLAF